MTEHLTTCITKPNRESRHEHITHIGNLAAQWRMSREQVIRRIDDKQEAFYTIDPRNNRKVYIGVVREPGKSAYLRTYADGDWNNNLLALSDCNGSCKLIA